jgi:hypothetical protein
MKSHTIKAIIILITGIMVASCTTTVEQAVSTGKNAEILIYMDKKLWQSDLGDSLQSIFMQPQQGLNQIEPMFTMLHMAELDDLFKKHRNILSIEINDTIKEPVLQYSEHVFAKPQTYVEAKASSKEQMVTLLRSAENILFEKFRQTDYARIQRAYKMQESVVIQNKVKNMFGVSMVIPKSFYIAKESPDFMWLRLETNKYSQGLLVYRKEFVDSTAMQPQSLIAWKNSITQEHIPGEVEGSYMRTDTATSPIVNYVKWNNTKVLETRGLWLTIGDFMGGPYVTLFMTDPDLKYIYAFDAYVYYPSRDKRDLVLQLEGIIHSVRFIKN